MFNLDPGKLIVIAVVAIILLGPDKLPQFARQVGGAWRTFNDFRRRMESEVRSTMPDLPPSSEIARLARSPAALLTHLSNMAPEEEAADGEAPDGSFQPPPAQAEAGANGEGTAVAGAAGTAGAAGATDRTDGANGTDGADGADKAGETGETGGSGGAASKARGIDVPAPATNGRPAVAPQPADVSVPADPTLN